MEKLILKDWLKEINKYRDEIEHIASEELSKKYQSSIQSEFLGIKYKNSKIMFCFSFYRFYGNREIEYLAISNFKGLIKWKLKQNLK